MNVPDLSTDPVGAAAPDPEEDDIRLVERVAAGDADALAELYERHGQVIFSQVVFVVGDHALAEEVLQDTMLAVWRQAGAFRGEARVRSWMIAIARRRARDRLRRGRLWQVEDKPLVNEPSPSAGPELVALERAEVAEVVAAIKMLGRSHREVFGLVFAAGLTMAEVADILHIPIGTAKSRLSAARTALCRTLDEETKEGKKR